MILDCQNEKTALTSVADYFGKSPVIISDLIKTVDFNSLHERVVDDYDYFTDFLFEYFRKKFGVGMIDEIMWYHLSRSLNPESYCKGILPLNEVLPQLQSDLYCLVKDRISNDEWIEICNGKGAGFRRTRFDLKRECKDHYGPYAMLVREIAFNSNQVRNHDYLRIPEIVEDMCMGMENEYGIDLIGKYIEKSTPVITKFRKVVCDHEKDKNYIGTALCYLYCKLNNKRLSLICNTCFCGYGEAIKAEDIITVEVLEKN